MTKEQLTRYYLHIQNVSHTDEKHDTVHLQKPKEETAYPNSNTNKKQFQVKWICLIVNENTFRY